MDPAATVAGMDVTAETFDRDVVERSHARPVVVDFWAEWCGPCHVLAPVLEQAVAARADDVELAKVDVDANPALAERYGIRGIPAVKAFRRGHVVDEFVGALPPAAVGTWLDGLTGPTEAERLAADLRARGEATDALDALDAGDHDRALELLLDEVAAVDDPDARDRLRALMVAIFAELGAEHPSSVRYRRRLATTLY